jgi:steroid delta-isomerase-like uncharacterized protein
VRRIGAHWGSATGDVIRIWRPSTIFDLIRTSILGVSMNDGGDSEAAKAVVRRNTEEVQNKGDFEVFEELFADDFVDHTPQQDTSPDKPGVRILYSVLRAAFADFHAVIHWQTVEAGLVTTYKTYHGTHQGEFLGVPPTGRKVQFESVDAMRVVDGKITEHWGVGNLLSLMWQLGNPPGTDQPER